MNCAAEEDGMACAFGTAVIISAIMFPLMYLSDKERKEELTEKLRGSSKVYCPSTYKLIKGDGAFTFDHSVPAGRKLVKVISVSDGFVYTLSNEAFSINECVVKD